MTQEAREDVYFLKWHTYSTHLTSGVKDFLAEGDFLTDVTLVAEGKPLKAHRFLLTLCSPHFKQLFQGTQEGRNHNANANTIVILNNVRFQDLVNLVQFIYNGEVSVRNDEELQGFLQLGALLQVQGLAKAEDAKTAEGQDGSVDASTVLQPRSSHIFSARVRKKRPVVERPPGNPTPARNILKRGRVPSFGSRPAPLRKISALPGIQRGHEIPPLGIVGKDDADTASGISGNEETNVESLDSDDSEVALNLLLPGIKNEALSADVPDMCAEDYLEERMEVQSGDAIADDRLTDHELAVDPHDESSQEMVDKKDSSTLTKRSSRRKSSSKVVKRRKSAGSQKRSRGNDDKWKESYTLFSSELKQKIRQECYLPQDEGLTPTRTNPGAICKVCHLPVQVRDLYDAGRHFIKCSARLGWTLPEALGKFSLSLN